MKKYFLGIISFIFSSMIVQAQTLSWGPEVALSYHNFFSNNSNYVYDFKLGIKAGMNLNIPLGKEKIINTGLFYQLRGAERNFTSGALKSFEDYQLGYIMLPVNYSHRFRINYGRSGYIFVLGGPYLAYGLHGKHNVFDNTSGDLVKLSETTIDWSNYNPFDYGLMIGARYEFPSGFYFNCSYHYGLSSFSSNANISLKQQSFQIGSGLNFWTWIK